MCIHRVEIQVNEINLKDALIKHNKTEQKTGVKNEEEKYCFVECIKGKRNYTSVKNNIPEDAIRDFYFAVNLTDGFTYFYFPFAGFFFIHIFSFFDWFALLIYYTVFVLKTYTQNLYWIILEPNRIGKRGWYSLTLF